MTAYEVLKDILEKWEIYELYYFDFHKDSCIVKYGRKGYNYERQMTEEEFYKLIRVVEDLGFRNWIGIFDSRNEKFIVEGMENNERN